MPPSAPERYSLIHPPRDFYCIPVSWLGDTESPGELDARELLLAFADEQLEGVAFDDRGRNYWVRGGAPGEPDIVSYRTLNEALERLKTAGRLAPGPARDTWQLEGHGDGEAGFLRRPRQYISNRWPAWLPQGRWEMRAALVGLAGLMSEAGAPEVVATRKQIRAAALALLPAYAEEARRMAERVAARRAQDLSEPATDPFGDGLRRLAALGVVTPGRGGYRHSVHAFDALPQVSNEAVARSCQLDPVAGAHWIDLIGAVLRAWCLPPGRAPKVWREIRLHQPHIATAEDALALQRLVEARARGGSVRFSRLLADFVAARRREAWTDGPEFSFNLSGAKGTGWDCLLPAPSPAHPGAAQLVVRCVLKGRLRTVEAVELLQQISLWLELRREDGAVLRVALPYGSPPGESDVRFGFVIPCNQLHRYLSSDGEMRLVAESARASRNLVLVCRFRIAAAEGPRGLEQGCEESIAPP